MPPYSRVAEGLLRSNLAFKFAALYRNTHPAPKDIRDFEVSESLYKEFEDYVNEEGFEFQTQTEKHVERLREKAVEESFSATTITSMIALEAEIEADKRDALSVHKEEIKELLEYEIASCYFRAPGMVEAGFDDDPDLQSAYQLFGDLNRMNEVLKTDGVE
jgi:carboxyl-terminal processing protease